MAIKIIKQEIKRLLTEHSKKETVINCFIKKFEIKVCNIKLYCETSQNLKKKIETLKNVSNQKNKFLNETYSHNSSTIFNDLKKN